MTTRPSSDMKRAAPTVLAVAVVLFVAPILVTSLTHSASIDRARTWQSMTIANAREAENFISVADTARAADAVVLGEITEVREGRVLGDEGGDKVYVPRTTLRIDKLLSGDLPAADRLSLQLEFATLEQPNLEVLRKYLVGTAGLFFLRNKGRDAVIAGQDVRVQEAESPFYRLVNSTGMVVDTADGSWLPLAWERTSVTDEIQSRSFGELVDSIRQD